MAYVDRGGGREGKNHARRVKRGLLAKANPFDKKDGITMPSFTESPPAPALTAPRVAESLIDCGCALLSRQLARDQARMLSRAQGEHVDAVISFVSDFERAGELATLVKASTPGYLYLAAGIHPDNIKRVTDKTILSRMTEVRAQALTPECVTLWTGIDLTRDLASHYSQERLLLAQLELAADIELPAIIQQTSAAERLVELLTEARANVLSAAAAGPPDGTPAAPADATATSTPLFAQSSELPCPVAIAGLETLDDKSYTWLVAAGAHFIVDGTVTEEGSAADAVRALVSRIPMPQLLLASAAPLHTPQNISDHFVRTTRNEPSTLPYVLRAVAGVMNDARAATGDAPLTIADIAAAAYDNAVRLFRLQDARAASDAIVEPAAAGTMEAAEGDDSEASDSSDEGATAAAPVAVSTPADEVVPTASAAAAAPASHVRFLCRTCRAVLFGEADVMPHTASGIRPSANSVAGMALPGPSTLSVDAGGKGAASKRKGARGKQAAAGGSPAASPLMAPSAAHAPSGMDLGPAASITVGSDVAVGRWHSAKGKHVSTEGVCRQLLVDYIAWMSIDPSEAEGSLLCPGCSSKIGQYNLGGLKCSCGLLVAPAYKVARNRVDEELEGADAMAAALAATDLDDEDDGGADRGPSKKRNEKSLRVPVSKHKGNFR